MGLQYGSYWFQARVVHFGAKAESIVFRTTLLRGRMSLSPHFDMNFTNFRVFHIDGGGSWQRQDDLG